MPDTITRTVEIDGEEHEVEIDPSEHGFVPEDRLQDRISKAVAKAQKGRYSLDEITEADEVLDRLAESDETLARLRERRPDVFRNGDSGEGGPEEGKLEEKLDEHRKAWEAKHLKPLKKERDEYEQRVQRLINDRVDRDILQAFQEASVRGDKGQRELLREYYRGRVQYSPDHDETFLIDEDGEFIPSGDGDMPFLTIEADLEQKREDDEFGSWFADKTRPGSGFGEPGSGEATGGWRSKGKLEMDAREKRRAMSELVEQHGRAEGRQKWEQWPLRKG